MIILQALRLQSPVACALGYFLWGHGKLGKKRVYCFVDGFNLFHAIDDLRPKNNRLKWLDLAKLTEAFIMPSAEELKAVYYFSAYPTWLPESHKIHKKYVKALQAVGVIPVMGRFKEKKRFCKAVCRKHWISHEEKESDVNLALYMLHHAHLRNYDKAIIITADSDLCPIINLLRSSFPDKETLILTPPNRYSIAREFRYNVPTKKIKIKHLQANLLPNEIYGSNQNFLVTIPNKYK